MSNPPRVTATIRNGEWKCAVCGADIAARFTPEGNIEIKIEGDCQDPQICIPRAQTLAVTAYNDFHYPPEYRQ